MSTFFRLFGVTLLVLLIHTIALFSGVYEAYRWFDAPMHFSGGVAMAVLALEAWRRYVPAGAVQEGTLFSIPSIIKVVAILGFVALVSIGWEWFEFLVDVFLSQTRGRFGLLQPSIQDTMGDFFLDLLGGGLTFVVYEFKMRNQKRFTTQL